MKSLLRMENPTTEIPLGRCFKQQMASSGDWKNAANRFAWIIEPTKRGK